MSNEPIQADEAGNVVSFGTDASFLRMLAARESEAGNPVEAHRLYSIADSLELFGAAASPTIEAAIAFVRGLDANARQALITLGMAAFDQYVTSLPGPDFLDSTAKATARPHIEVAIRNAINDLCGGA